MENNKFKRSLVPIGFLVLFVGLAVAVTDSNVNGKIPDIYKGFLVGSGITLVIGSFLINKNKKQKLG